MRFYTTLLASFLIAQLSFSQDLDTRWQLSGQVSSDDGSPLYGASIIIEGTYLGVYTDQQGNFVFNRLNEGSYSLSISYLGYSTLTKEIDLRSDLSIIISLESSLIMTEEIVVKGIRASGVTPVAQSVMDGAEIKKANTGQDLPYLLALQPSVVATSEAGTGIGYTNLRIRGTDASRINITLDGIPLNDPESQQVFWVNMPDLAGSISGIQIQRGVGTSTNGAGAFGGSINMTSEHPSEEAYSQISGSYGSFNTYKVSAKVGTGIIADRFKMDMRFSGVQSDGFIDRASSSHRSLMISGQYRLKRSMLKANFIHGEQVTGISWWGTPADSLGTNRTYNPAGEYIDTQGNLRYYNGQDDNYTQTHYHLIYNWQISENLYLRTAGHFTRGAGYYEQYKQDEKLSDYNLPNWILHGLIDNVILDQTDLIRRKWLYNNYYGGVFNLNYSGAGIDASFGGGINRYVGDHFGRIMWMRWAGTTEIDHQWYINGGQKDEINLYAKVNYQLNKRLSLFGDLQYRYIDYLIRGTDDDLRYLDIDHRYNFFNPKAGLFLDLNQNQDIYASLAVANREPSRTNFKDAAGDEAATPLAETMYDFEGGYNLKFSLFSASLNIYYMHYKNQLVPTGKLSSVGYPIMTNVELSYRSGIELSVGLKPVDLIEWNASLTLSRNIIRNFTEYSSNYNSIFDVSESISFDHGDVQIAYSPSIIASSDIAVNPTENVQLHLISKFVGKQYFDNTQSEDRTIDPYFVNNLRLDFNPEIKGFKGLGIQLQVNNLFNTLYENNAYGGNWYEDMQEYTWAYYFPQAGINYLLKMTIAF